MIVELHNKLGKPQVIEATRIVLRCPVNGPICVAMECGKHHQFVIHRGDGDEAMNRALATMGIDETVVTDMIDKGQIKKPPGKLWKPGEAPPNA